MYLQIDILYLFIEERSFIPYKNAYLYLSNICYLHLL